MAKVKAEYLLAKDETTGEEQQVQFIPPAPSGNDLGGISLADYNKIVKGEVLDVEVTQKNSNITSNYTFDHMLTAYSAGRDIRVRFTSDNYSGKEFIMHNVGYSATKIEFHTIMELNGKLILLELECDNTNDWDLYSKQYIQTDEYYNAIADGAGAHNAVYRGKSLGTTITEAQLKAISDGTFKDLFIGDYWTISGVKYIIAHFDYMYQVGDTALTKHHIVVLPERNLYSYVMNDTDTTANGYTASKMYTSGLDTALTSFKNAFGESHVLTYRNLLVNATSSGNPTNWVWVNRQIDLMSETMVYGHKVWGMSGYEVGCQKQQFALFIHRHDMINIGRDWYWLRNVYSSAGFAYVSYDGVANTRGASNSGGVRPYALIG